MTSAGRLAQAIPFAIATLAIAGLVHIGTIFAAPNRARGDAFSQIAQLAPDRAKTDLPPPTGGAIPFRDAAMKTAVCRFDLASGPFRIGLTAFDSGLVSLGMHSRSGVAFYGLNLHAGETGALSLVLMTDQQMADADDPEADQHELRIIAPEQQGFVLIQSPTEGAGGGADGLDHVTCGLASSSPAGAAR